MREAIGSSMLLYIFIFFIIVVMLFFVGILSFSKAYRVKNRIIDIIENKEDYNDDVAGEIEKELLTIGYSAKGDCGKYCVVKIWLDKNCSSEDRDVQKNCDASRGYYYKVTTYMNFEFPIIKSLITVDVKGETKVMGKSYDY